MYPCLQPIGRTDPNRSGGYMPLRAGHVTDFTPNFFKPGMGGGGGGGGKVRTKNILYRALHFQQYRIFLVSVLIVIIKLTFTKRLNFIVKILINVTVETVSKHIWTFGKKKAILGIGFKFPPFSNVIKTGLFLKR